MGYTPINILSLFNMYFKKILKCDKMLSAKVINTMFTGKLNLKSLLKGNELENTIYNYAKAKNIFNISQIKMPLAIPTVDLQTGDVIYFLNNNICECEKENIKDNPLYFYSGNISSIVRASSCFPGIFEPKKINSKILIDGGVRVNTPVSILKSMGADKVLAVSFDKNKISITKDLNIISVAMKSFEIMGNKLNSSELEIANLVITPYVANASLLDCSKINQLATEGYNITKKNINKIKEIIIE